MMFFILCSPLAFRRPGSRRIRASNSYKCIPMLLLLLPPYWLSLLFALCVLYRRLNLIAYISRSRPLEDFSHAQLYTMVVFCLRSRLFVSWDLYSVHFGWPLLNHLKSDKEIQVLSVTRENCYSVIDAHVHHTSNNSNTISQQPNSYKEKNIIAATKATTTTREAGTTRESTWYTTNYKLKPWLWID